MTVTSFCSRQDAIPSPTARRQNHNLHVVIPADVALLLTDPSDRACDGAPSVPSRQTRPSARHCRQTAATAPPYSRSKGLTRLSKRHDQQRINIRIARITRDVLNFRRKKVKPQRLGPVRRRHDHHIFNGVQHLPHIAGPPIALHPRQHLVTKLNPRKTGTPRHQIDKMAGQMWDVLAAFGKRRMVSGTTPSR